MIAALLLLLPPPKAELLLPKVLAAQLESALVVETDVPVSRILGCTPWKAQTQLLVLVLVLLQVRMQGNNLKSLGGFVRVPG